MATRNETLRSFASFLTRISGTFLLLLPVPETASLQGEGNKEHRNNTFNIFLFLLLLIIIIFIISLKNKPLAALPHCKIWNYYLLLLRIMIENEICSRLWSLEMNGEEYSLNNLK